MGENSSKSPSSGPSSPRTPLGAPRRKVFDKFFWSASTCGNNPTLGVRRRLRGDVEEEFQYAASYCLSSYYSVFVVRLAIMAMLAILIGMLTILTWHFTKVYTTKSLDSLAYGLLYELLQRPLLRMWNVLNSTIEITTAQVKMSEYIIRQYSSEPVTQAQQVELYEMMKDVTWALFSSHKALNAITINYKNGFVQGFHRDHRSHNTFYIYSDLVNYSISNSYELSEVSSHQRWNDQSIHGNLSAIWYREPLDPVSGEKKGKRMKIPPDDLINIAGPSQVPDGVASWHVAVSKYTDSPLLSAALPVWDSSNKSIVAVVGVTTALYSVGQLMRELVEVHSGHIYLTSEEGYLLATSTNAPLLRNSTTGPKLVMALESEDRVIQEGAQWLQRTYPDKFPPSHSVHVENAKLGGKKYYIDSFFLNLKRLPMLGVVLVPREYIMGKADQRAFKTLVILICASVCILIIGCICILILTNGVSKEMKLRAELISQLDARRRAEASSNYKSQFLANMSHELRTPMAAVIGLLDILICDDYLTNEQYATVTQIRRCSNALLRLLNNILDLSKVEAGKLELESTEFNLGQELEALIDMFSVQCNHHVETLLDLSDDMPKWVRGDSARVIQIFANLISNSIKFTTSGHIILRGWCEKSNVGDNKGRIFLTQESGSPLMGNSLRQGSFMKFASKKDKVKLCFEVEDTGFGIDPSKWESVFESFEQADPSTTRMHGGTGLGLCIVRTLVHKMGGEIKIVEKNSPGTLMQLCLVLGTSTGNTEQYGQVEFATHNLVVILALSGSTGRTIMSQWLHKKGLLTWRASDWNELTQMLRRAFQENGSLEGDSIEMQPQIELFQAPALKDLRNSKFVIVIDICLLDLSTNIWKEQLSYLNEYAGKAKFAWILNQETSTSVKTELQRRGHLLMVNRPLYKSKMIQILEAVINESGAGYTHECLEIDPTHYDGSSCEDSDKADDFCLSSESTKKREKIKEPSFSQLTAANNYLLELEDDFPESNDQESKREERNTRRTSTQIMARNSDEGNNLKFAKNMSEQKCLEGLKILLAEDTPVLQRVASIMLEKVGARVIAVGDGLQAVNALRCSLYPEGCFLGSPMKEERTCQTQSFPPFDLILMDCQMPKMDGYEATKEIRRLELGIGTHIPIVALTAHAMLSDEAKCLEVGMDAYLTKPIDYKLMVSTILSLTRKVS